MRLRWFDYEAEKEESYFWVKYLFLKWVVGGQSNVFLAHINQIQRRKKYSWQKLWKEKSLYLGYNSWEQDFKTIIWDNY